MRMNHHRAKALSWTKKLTPPAYKELAAITEGHKVTRRARDTRAHPRESILRCCSAFGARARDVTHIVR